MNRKIITVSVLAVGIISCKGKTETYVSPVTAPITEAVFAPGHIEAGKQFSLMAYFDGYIREVPVTEGDLVKNGQLVVQQDNTTSAIQQQAATENLHISQQQASAASGVLQQLQAQLRSAEQTLLNNQTQYDRMARLLATHSVSKLDADNAKLAYDNAVANVEAISQNIAATKLNLQQSVVNSRSSQQTAAANTQYYNLVAPGNYKVYTLLKRKGDFVKKGEVVAMLGNPDSMIVVLNIDETSIAKVQLQQKVLVALNTEKSNTYTAHISRIYPQYDDNLQAYKVEAIFDSLPARLINGTLLQANIIVGSKDKALLVPRSCLSPDNKVIVRNDKKNDTILVKPGIISTDWVEILQGVSMSDKLLKAY
ncbi:efflux RND transporter periplasmic adaptor subunit [Chitinophaga sp. Cy-1792]|uniref:efflux RND transporter periplasmic adaptor subunit n=1 Tax=Chitinophaga sp. Cy-1792 TaxID=2608339 RepID=UPI00141ED5AE|nr:HlyD family efflux transporter periplasmic adaptor subunit [Chitinophaga sp. Cy-1792]NIG56401.1 HlyD family efflux transporter periplasmic adaptor subunit [Chitinophaga sp. Cy-1792]